MQYVLVDQVHTESRAATPQADLVDQRERAGRSGRTASEHSAEASAGNPTRLPALSLIASPSIRTPASRLLDLHRFCEANKPAPFTIE